MVSTSHRLPPPPIDEERVVIGWGGGLGTRGGGHILVQERGEMGEGMLYILSYCQICMFGNISLTVVATPI